MWQICDGKQRDHNLRLMNLEIVKCEFLFFVPTLFSLKFSGILVNSTAMVTLKKFVILYLIGRIVCGATNLLCNETEWQFVSGKWAFNHCSALLTDQTLGAVIWLGNKDWINYNVTVSMQLLDPASPDDNAGILFRAKSVSAKNNGGQVMRK